MAIIKKSVNTQKLYIKVFCTVRYLLVCGMITFSLPDTSFSMKLSPRFKLLCGRDKVVCHVTDARRSRAVISGYADAKRTSLLTLLC